ncbi:MAG: UDP-N-acetylmuramyl-tripeptide synthetase [Nannocystaceae bacterium]
MSTPKRPVAAAAPWAEPMFTCGVTGTNGKTSTCRLLTAILREDARSVLEITTLGVRLDDRALPRGKRFADFIRTLEAAAADGCRDAVLEATSHGLAQGYARSWRFDLGVFTNLSPDHLSRHGSWEHYLAAKAQLFIHLGPGRSAILNAGDPHSLFIDQATAMDVRRRWYWAPHRGPRVHDSELSAAAIELSPEGTTITLERSPTACALGGRLVTRLVGEVFAENALAAALAGLAAGVDAATVAAGIAACEPVPGRFEVVVHGPARPTVVVDYAHTADALVHTCRSARRLAGERRVLVVFGAGGGATPEKRRPMGAAVGAAADLAVVTSDNPRDEDPAAIARALVDGLRDGGRATWHTELDRRAAIHAALAEAAPGDVVLIAGKGHEDGQEVAGRVLPFSDREVATAYFA